MLTELTPLLPGHTDTRLMDIPNLCQSNTEKEEKEDILQPVKALPDRNKS